MDTPSGGFLVGPGGTSIPVVRLRGAPYDRGLQRGRQIPSVIRRRVDRVLSVYRGRGLVEEAYGVAAREQKFLEKHSPDIIAELQGIAESTRIPWDDLRVSALVMTVHHYPPALGARRVYADEDCLCFAASRAATIDGRPLLGKNGDFVTAVTLPEDQCILDVVPDVGHAYVAVGPYPERTSQPEGMNEFGLTVVGAGQYPKDGYDAYEAGSPTGISVFHRLGTIYAGCRTLDEALDVLKDSPRGYTGRVMILGDASGNWVKVEVTYENIRIQHQEPDARYCANFVAAGVSGTFGAPDMQALITTRTERPAAYARYDRIMSLLIEKAGQIDLAFAKSLFRDHAGSPSASSICKHTDGPDMLELPLPTLEALPTLESFIFQPDILRVWIASGRPCETEYVPYDLTSHLRDSGVASMAVSTMKGGVE